MPDELNEEEIREMYARFGLAYYLSSALEYGVVNALFIIELMEKRRLVASREQWNFMVDNHFQESFEKTLGILVKQLSKHLDRSGAFEGLIDELKKCLAERNFLAHHFWRKYATHWYTADGRHKMFKRLDEATDLFYQTDQNLEAALQPFADEYGFAPDRKRAALELMKREITGR